MPLLPSLTSLFWSNGLWSKQLGKRKTLSQGKVWMLLLPWKMACNVPPPTAFWEAESRSQGSRPHCVLWSGVFLGCGPRSYVSAPWKREQGHELLTLSRPIPLSLTGLEALQGNSFGLFWKCTQGASHQLGMYVFSGQFLHLSLTYNFPTLEGSRWVLGLPGSWRC